MLGLKLMHVSKGAPAVYVNVFTRHALSSMPVKLNYATKIRRTRSRKQFVMNNYSNWHFKIFDIFYVLVSHYILIITEQPLNEEVKRHAKFKLGHIFVKYKSVHVVLPHYSRHNYPSTKDIYQNWKLYDDFLFMVCIQQHGT